MIEQATIRANKEKYCDAEPKFLGDLHQRMKHVIQALEECRTELARDPRLRGSFTQLATAICDLETEVAGHTPWQPPVGKRA